MKSEDIGALMRGVATVVKEHVGTLASSVYARLADVEKRLDGLPAVAEKAEPGPAGASAFDLACAGGFTGTEDDWLASLHGRDGPPGVSGLDGKSVSLDDLAPLLDAELSKRVAEIPAAKDGASVTLDDVRPLVDEAVQVAVAAIPTPKDGASVSLDDVRPLIKQAVADALLSDDAHTLVGSALQSLTEAITAKFAAVSHAG